MKREGTAKQPRRPATTGEKLQAIFEAAAHQTRPDEKPESSAVAMSKGEKDVLDSRELTEQPDGVYIISVAARILSMHPQTLRKYERVGLVRPSRTVGMLRLYSEEDIAKLRMIKHLVDELRLNLAGVEMALAVFDRLAAARDRMSGPSVSSKRVLEQTVQEILALLQGQQASHRGDED